MSSILKVSLEKVSVVGISRLGVLNGVNVRVATLAGGGVVRCHCLLREIGNNRVDTWENVDKIRKLTSNKNKLNYIRKFEDGLRNIKVID